MKQNRNSIIACNVICVLLIIVVFILQLTPYWTLEDQVLSIGDLVWAPLDHGDLQSHLADLTGEAFDINDFVFGPVFLEIFCLIAVAFLLWKPAGLLPGITNIIVGILGMVTYITSAPLQTSMHWSPHLVLYVDITLLGIASICMAIIFCKTSRKH